MKKNISKKIRVVVAMSGGVDSSVVAYLLKKQGYDVIGVFLKFWTPGSNNQENKPLALQSQTPGGKAIKQKTKEEEYICSLGEARENACCDMRALMLARQVAGQLDIPFYTINVSTYFKKEIVDYFISEYEAGRTPNPCVICNEKVKFGVLWKKARALGADFLATGHYVKSDLTLSGFRQKSLSTAVERGRARSASRVRLFRSKDITKDQTYFLSGIDKNIIPHLLFPLGDMVKSEVREIAKKAKLPVYNKKDSTGVCFIPDGDTSAFLSHYSKKLDKPGDIADKNGNKLGRHEGLMGHTIGERVGGLVESYQVKKLKSIDKNKINKKELDNFKTFDFITKPDVPRLYVTSIDTKKNQLIIGENADCFTDTLIAENVNIIDQALFTEKTILAQIRGGHAPEKAKIISVGADPCVRPQKGKHGGLPLQIPQITIQFLHPVRAITPGQTVAFYSLRGRLLGGGIIMDKKSIKQ